MKGKGKGKGIPTKGKSSRQVKVVDHDKEQDNSKDATDLKECPLQFPDFSPVDHSRTCPRFSAILSRTEEEGIGLEDLGTLQLELETLLASVSKRMGQLEGEVQILVNWQEKKELKKPIGGKIQPQVSGKRSKSGDEKTCKKLRDGSGTSKVSHNVSGPGRPKNKILQQAKAQDYELPDSPVDTPRVPKNDAPNRFWSSVEPYCCDITMEDMKIIEDLLKCHDDDTEYYKIPALGKHYSIKWAQEDMLEEQKEGMKVNEKRRGLSNSSTLNTGDADRLLKKAEKECDDDTSPFGTLTQRLVSCLIEENIMTPLEDSMADLADVSEGNSSSAVSKGSFIKSLNISNTSQLERRIKRELEEQGILEHEDCAQENPDDEILAELSKCQAELKVVSAHNMQAKRRLLKIAREEMTRQELRKKMQIIDAEVMDVYRRITAVRQKKKTPTKKEKDQAWKALRERENLLKTLSTSWKHE